MKAEILEYTPFMRGDVLNMKLRKADQEEVKASNGLTPFESLKFSLDVSQKVWVAKGDNKIIAVFGLSLHPDYEHIAVPWLLGTDDLKHFKKQFMKESQKKVESEFFPDKVTMLTNFVSTKNTDSIKWLEWLGFSLLDGEIFLADKETPFKQFVKWKGDYHV